MWHNNGQDGQIELSDDALWTGEGSPVHVKTRRTGTQTRQDFSPDGSPQVDEAKTYNRQSWTGLATATSGCPLRHHTTPVENKRPTGHAAHE